VSDQAAKNRLQVDALVAEEHAAHDQHL